MSGRRAGAEFAPEAWVWPVGRAELDLVPRVRPAAAILNRPKPLTRRATALRFGAIPMKTSRLPRLSVSAFVRRGLMLSLATVLGAGSLAAAQEVLSVGFDKLASFEFVAPDDPSKAEAAEKQIPDTVRELDAKKVAVTGFMLPVKMEEGMVKEFLLVKDPMMCCYGAMPKVNEWVVVKMVGKGTPPLMDVPITFEGQLEVGQIYEGGYLTGLYLLKGERRVEQKG